ncbi:MAG: glutamate--tRNA ligase, partial [Candidatus Eremiobacterota bacterium]
AGVSPTEGAGIGGDFGPYVQSERLWMYREHAARLVNQGDAYPCFCTPQDLGAMRERLKAEGRDPMYDRRCRHLDPAEAARRVGEGEKHVIRMKIPDDEVLAVDDLVRGRVEFHSRTVDDQVLMKSDGFPTYHLAAVVDDHLMEISHVIRGEEWLSSTPKHVLLYRYFGWEAPRFAHLPLILNKERKKLSKRDGDVAVEAYRDKGYLPVALLNFLALIGWSPGDEREVFTLEELVQAFELERVNKSGGIFDLDKLNHIQKQHLKRMPAPALMEAVLPWFDRAGRARPEPAYLARVVELMRERATVLPDFVEVAYFYQDPTEFDAKTFKKRWKADSPELVTRYAGVLESLTEWSAPALEECLRTVTGPGEAPSAGSQVATKALSPGDLIHPTRLALSGTGVGPGLFEMMEVLGRETCLRRMRHAAEHLRADPA